ncbi:helix-turn-helix domain-containing protein [Microbacterium gubbeenense]|uniref:helix-turn-helix domain-containing protein n=1 Tax=Microbacterium gubbeenense TaxID=159896 RepID=UPI00055B84FF|nr:helix-turn-helix transcriptional regulator [Microbacterium gubbeenense]
MSSEPTGKDLVLTRTAIERATQHERLLYGELVGDLRAARGMTQATLAERSAVTARTIRNIEKGAVAPQAEKLIRLFVALDVDLDGTMYSAEVQAYVAMLAPLIRDIDPEHRLAAVADLIPALSRAVAAHPRSN